MQSKREDIQKKLSRISGLFTSFFKKAWALKEKNKKIVSEMEVVLKNKNIESLKKKIDLM